MREAPAASPLLLTHSSSWILLIGLELSRQLTRASDFLPAEQTTVEYLVSFPLYIPSTQPRSSETFLLNFGLQVLRIDTQMIFVNLLSISPPCS